MQKVGKSAAILSHHITEWEDQNFEMIHFKMGFLSQIVQNQR